MEKRIIHKRLSFIIASTLISCSLYAQESEKVVNTLGQINMFAGSEGDPRFGDTSIFDEEMRLQENNTIDQALNSISGVYTEGSGIRSQPAIRVRGWAPQYAPLYIDGIPISNPYDETLDFTTFTTYDYEQIQVSKGLSSPLIGINNFAGAINLVTKKPTKEFEGVASVGAFSGVGRKAYLNLGTKQEKFYTQVSGTYLDRDNYPISNKFDFNDYQSNDKRIRSHYTNKKVNVKLAWTPNDTDEYAINYINQKTDKGMPFAAEADANPGRMGRFRDWDYNDQESWYFLSNTNFEYGYLKSRIYYDQYENLMAFYQADKRLANGDWTSTYKNKNYSMMSPYVGDKKGISLELGQYDTQRNSLKLAFHARRDTQKNDNKKYQNDRIYEQQMDYYSIGLEDTFRFTDNFRLIIGASWDKAEIKKAENEGRDFDGMEEFPYSSDSSFNPMAKFEYDYDDTLSFYAGVAKKTKFASLQHRFSYDDRTELPSPDLKPEQTINYELGVSKIFDNQGIKAVLFYQDVKDLIDDTIVTRNGRDFYQYQNIDKVKNKGYELEYFYELDNTLSFNANYSRILMKDKSTDEDKDPRNNRLYKFQVPEHKLVVSATYRPIKEITANVNMQYTSSRIDDSMAGQEDLGSATIWNAKLIYNITNSLSLDAGMLNMFDKNYEYSYGFPEAGRVLYTNLTYKF